jgi:hypothetical protein
MLRPSLGLDVVLNLKQMHLKTVLFDPSKSKSFNFPDKLIRQLGTP